MVFTAPAVHYSALATTPPKVDASNSQPLIKWNQIIKRFFRSDDRQLSETTAGSSEMKHWSNETDLSIVKPCSAHADQTTLSDRVETEAPKIPSTLVGPTERLPFSGPYLSSAPNNERESSKLSSYHRHCTRQEKFVHQKQYPSTTNYSDPSDSPTAGKESSSNFVSYRLQNALDLQRTCPKESHPDNVNYKTALSTLPFHDSCTGLRRNSLSNRLGNPWSCAGSQSSRLRRLQSKSKVRPVSSSESKAPATTASAACVARKRPSVASSSISSSIAHRIELLKQAMHHDQEARLDEKTDLPSPSLETSHRETQTTKNSSKYTEMHYIHHHYLHTASIFSLQWRPVLSILATLSLVLLFFLEILTILL